MRYTRTFIKARFALAMSEIGGEVGDQPGQYCLDHAAVYGGYRIDRRTDNGGYTMPFGSSRYSAQCFIAHLDGIIYTAGILRRNH